MSIDLAAAAAFMQTHARMVDRRRFDLMTGAGDPDALFAAVEAYRNDDGGYGSGLEADLRSVTSQPGGALHAFEAFAEAGPRTTPRAVELCDWMASASLADGGVPFALPIPDPAGSAPFWVGADPAASSLQITAAVTAAAQRVAVHDPAVREHPWLAGAVDYCLAAIDALGPEPFAIGLMFAIQLLDAVHETRPEAPALMARLGELIPASGVVPVTGGSEGEAMRPLDFAPRAAGAARALFDPDVIAADLRRLEGEQRDDGGWEVDFASYSPRAALDWRGYATVRAVSILRERA